MTSVNQRKLPHQHWYEDPIKRGVAIISGFLLVAGLGYSAATIVKNLELRMEKYEMKQEFNEKIQAEIHKCTEEKQVLKDKKLESLETVVKQIQTSSNGSK